MSGQALDVVVVGSINVDLRLDVAAIPRSGETILARGMQRAAGGKGANQAAAAARLGRRVAMVGAVGDDDAAALVLRRLAAEGVDTATVAREPGSTGTAIVLWERPESTIVVHAGANAAVTAEMVRERAETLRRARAVLCQLETPVEALGAVVATAPGLTILNPAPAQGPLPHDLLARFDLIVPNRFELGNLAGAPDEPRTLAEVEAAARSIGSGADWVVTLGDDGSLVVPGDGGDAVHVPALPVDAVDTTGAGDSFCAGLVDALLDGAPLLEAARWATRVAAVTTTRHGAMDSLPRRDEIPEAAGATR
ncbi:ribokinase [Georgenia thermotolerans]|uniref:Ribokinase n=1 Tax=Georgenia thermotolerans TaxID=527326 RepID=A0A7J5USF8_9MICO|nr:ribokinase [Georgenia thermotolerans]KAE8765319.1 ribokinase [Georgenia thermotolerans]